MPLKKTRCRVQTMARECNEHIILTSGDRDLRDHLYSRLEHAVQARISSSAFQELNNCRVGSEERDGE